MKEIESLARLLSSGRGSVERRRKMALALANEIYQKIDNEDKSPERRTAVSAFFHSVIKPLRTPGITEEDLVAVSAGMNMFEQKFAKALKEYRMYLVKDPDSRWARSTQYSKRGKREVQRDDKTKSGTKQRNTCDSCGATLVRKGPARRFGWGLYRCDYCGAEYTIKE